MVLKIFDFTYQAMLFPEQLLLHQDRTTCSRSLWSGTERKTRICGRSQGALLWKHTHVACKMGWPHMKWGSSFPQGHERISGGTTMWWVHMGCDSASWSGRSSPSLFLVEKWLWGLSASLGSALRGFRGDSLVPVQGWENRGSDLDYELYQFCNSLYLCLSYIVCQALCWPLCLLLGPLAMNMDLQTL